MFVCLVGCLFLRYVFLCVSLSSLVILCVIGCHTYFLKRSSECPLIFFDKDQPDTILIAAITDNLRSSYSLGSTIVVNMSLPTTKSSAKSKQAFCQTKPDKNLPSRLLLFCRLNKHRGSGVLSIGSNPPPQQMRDEFSMNVVS